MDNVTIQRPDKTTFEADASYVDSAEFTRLKRSHGLKAVETEQVTQAEPAAKDPESQVSSKPKPAAKADDAK